MCILVRAYIYHVHVHAHCILQVVHVPNIPLCTGAFYYLLGNLSPRFRSKIHNIQLLVLVKYTLACEYGIDCILKPVVNDIRRLESVRVQPIVKRMSCYSTCTCNFTC